MGPFKSPFKAVINLSGEGVKMMGLGSFFLARTKGLEPPTLSSEVLASIADYTGELVP